MPKRVKRLWMGLSVLLVLVTGWIALRPPRQTHTNPDASRQPSTRLRDLRGGGEDARHRQFGQPSLSERRIAGSVTFAGRPVPRARVELAGTGTAPALERLTDNTGGFDFGQHPPAKFIVAASAASRAPAIVEVDLRDPMSTPDHLELRLGECESEMSGRISDSSKNAIAGARICLAAPQPVACGISDTAGSYSLCLAPQQSLAMIAATGYGTIYDRVDMLGRHAQRNYTLIPEATIVGRVIHGSSSAGITGATIRAFAVDGLPGVSAPVSAISGEDGRFSIGGLAPGRVRLTAVAETLTTSRPVEVNAEAGRPTTDVVLRLESASHLSGIVTDGHAPIVGATISLRADGLSGFVDAVTQADGSFVLAPVPRRRMMLTVANHEVEEPKIVNVDRAEMANLRVVVTKMGSIAGHVRFRGRPLPDARVFCSRRAEPVFTDATGAYSISGLTPDRYELVAESPKLGASGEARGVSLSRGESHTGVDIDLKDAGAIAGVVVESDGKPVSGVSITFSALHSADAGSDVSAADGTFRVATLTGGDEYRAFLRVSARNRARIWLADGVPPPIVHLKDGSSEVSGVRIVVRRDHLSISGRIVDGQGQPFGDIRIEAWRSDRSGDITLNVGEPPGATSAGDGSFVIEDLDAGKFVLRARSGDGSEAFVRDVSAGRQGVVVTLQRAGGIDGTLLGFTAPPAVRALRLLAGTTQPNYFANIDNTTFHLRGLAAGSYQVIATGSETDAQVVEVRTAQIATVELRARKSATKVRGRVVEWRSRKPVSGISCSPGVPTSAPMPAWIDDSIGTTDENGSFVLENVATGPVAIACYGKPRYYSNGRAELVIIDGQDATCEVPVVPIAPDIPLAALGAQFLIGAVPARISAMVPRGAADRAGLRVGDIITSVDGAIVTMLTPMAVQIVISQRPAGSTVHLGVQRNNQELAIDMILTS